MPIADVLYGFKEVDEALPAYEEAERYANGNVAEWFSSERIASMIKSTATPHRFNLARIPITSLQDRVELTAVQDPDSESVTSALQEIWDANNMDIYIPHLINKTFTFGDAYLQVWPVLSDEDPDSEVDDPADLDSTDEDLALAGVELVVHDPKAVRVLYDPLNHRRKLFTIMRWETVLETGHTVWRVDLYYPDQIERYQSKPTGDLAKPEGWEEFTGDEDPGNPDAHILPNVFGEIPFFHFRTDLPYGQPIHAPAYGCQDALNKSLITQLSVMDAAGWPERYSLVEPGAELDQALDSPNDWDDEDVDSTDTLRGGQVGQGRTGPGIHQEFKGVKEVGQFDAADPMAFLEPAGFYVRLMAQLTNTPLHRFDPTGSLPSGESLKVAEAPQVKVALRQITMATAPMLEAWKFALQVAGITVRTLTCTWAPPQSATGLSDWETVKAKQDAGVPVDQTLVEAGYEETEVQGWLEAGAEELDLTRRVGLLATFAEGVSKLSGLVATGVMTAEQVDSVIKDITGLTVPAAPAKDRVPLAARPAPPGSAPAPRPAKAGDVR